jgi:hypothetical protein
VDKFLGLNIGLWFVGQLLGDGGSGSVGLCVRAVVRSRKEETLLAGGWKLDGFEEGR